jgi:hypothetical protein
MTQVPGRVAVPAELGPPMGTWAGVAGAQGGFFHRRPQCFPQEPNPGHVGILHTSLPPRAWPGTLYDPPWAGKDQMLGELTLSKHLRYVGLWFLICLGVSDLQ